MCLFIEKIMMVKYIFIQTLAEMTTDVPNVKCSDAKSDFNESKNRYQIKIPCEEIECVLLTL